jgi:endonuclease/exonuclease/phosphatase family metal-dependent hydrolase
MTQLPSSPVASLAAQPDTVRVMTFNIWVGGESGKQPLDQTAKVIQAAHAHIVGIQESSGAKRGGKRPNNARIIAEKLGWQFFSQDSSTSIATRHKIVGHTPKKWGAEIELPSGRRVWLFNAHFAHAPYQPYQLLRIPYEDAPFIDSAEAAIREANRTRGYQVAAMLAEIEAIRHAGAAIFVTGDFNEPTPLDWTDAACHAGRCPVAVKWPTAAAILHAGFTDTYRASHPDPLTAPGHTWTPTTASTDPTDRHDRIDFVLVSGPNARIAKSEIVGEHPDHADIVVTPYPSDHRAVVATVTLP